MLIVLEMSKIFYLKEIVGYFTIITMVHMIFSPIYHEMGHARQIKKIGGEALVTIHSSFSLKNIYFKYKKVCVFISNDDRIHTCTYEKENYTAYTDQQIKKIAMAGPVNTFKYLCIISGFSAIGLFINLQAFKENIIIAIMYDIIYMIESKQDCKKDSFNDFAIKKNPTAFREHVKQTTDTYEEINKIIKELIKK